MKGNSKTMKPALAAAPITSLAELRAVLGQPLVCQFVVDGRQVQLKVRRVTSVVDELRRAVLRAVLPPFVKERNDYDVMNPEYRRRREEAEEQARSILVYHCCPEIAALSPGLTQTADIHRAVKDLLPPTILELIALTALAGGLDAEVNRRTDFTLPPASES